MIKSLKHEPTHLKEIRAMISDRALELAPRDKQLRRVLHLWITAELKQYIGVRLFEEIPAETLELCKNLVATYGDKWVCAFELPPLRIEVNKNSNQ